MSDLIERQSAIDVDPLEKCLECKHCYRRIDDAETLYCRCRKGCRYEAFKITEGKDNG